MFWHRLLGDDMNDFFQILFGLAAPFLMPVAAITLFVIFISLVMTIFNAITGTAQYAKRRRENERLQKINEARSREQQAANHALAISQANDLVSSGQIAVASLPLSLAAAQSALDTAEKEFSEGLYSPFWEAMEEATQYLNLFNDTLAKIDMLHKQYIQKADRLGLNRKKFSLGSNLLPDPTPAQNRVTALYRKAQKISDFAQIYELRRNTSAVIAGFRSLGDAIYSLSSSIKTELQSLQSSLDFQLTDINSALRDANSQLQHQHEALLIEYRSWDAQAQMAQDEQVAVSRTNAERAQKSADAMLVMLDNIQHRRKPGLFEYG